MHFSLKELNVITLWIPLSEINLHTSLQFEIRFSNLKQASHQLGNEVLKISVMCFLP